MKTSGGTVLQDDKFTYDMWNRRIGKSTLAGGQSWTVYNGANPYADFNTSGVLTYRYLYGDAADFLLARFDGTNTAFYLTDLLGSVRMLVDKNATILDQLSYDSYGNILSESSPSSGDRFKYTGREWDSEIGLYYYRARYYTPAAGRFVSEDPSSFAAGDSNLYRYVTNGPTKAADPLGLQSTAPPATAGAKPSQWHKPIVLPPLKPAGPAGNSGSITLPALLTPDEWFNAQMPPWALPGSGLTIGADLKPPRFGVHPELDQRIQPYLRFIIINTNYHKLHYKAYIDTYPDFFDADFSPKSPIIHIGVGISY